jgi:anthranilate synthase component 1
MLNFTKEEFIKSGGFFLYKKIPCDLITPTLASLKLFSKFPNYHFLLESASVNKNRGRFSAIGVNPDLVWKCVGKKSFLNENFTQNKTSFIEQEGAPLLNLRQLIKKSEFSFDSLSYGAESLPAVCCGLFGYMGYDMVKLMEVLPNRDLPDEIGIPDAIFIRPQILVVFDNFYNSCLICAPSYDKKENYDCLEKKILSVEEVLNEGFEPNKHATSHEFSFSSNYTKDEFCDVIKKAKKFIVDGDIFQTLPSQRFVSDFPDGMEFNFYRSLRFINPSPFLFFLKFDDFVLTGSSPEIMVSVKDRKVTIRPLAGTRKRGKSLDEDKKIAEELLHDEKEVAEHLMLIDLGRHDVGRVSKEGTVNVTEKMTIENYSHVMHISSNVEGVLRDDLVSLDALISGFPAGTVSGAPKIRAIAIIEELEKIKRSFYAGCVGYFSSNGSMENCITLRSALIKGGKIYLQAGAGIVFDSDEESEYQECINKAQALIQAAKMIII